MLSNHGRSAVIDEEPRGGGLETKRLRLAGRRLGESGPASGPERSVEIDGMNHVAAGAVLQRDLDSISLPNSNHRARHLAVERPVAVSSATGSIQHSDDFFGRKRHMNYSGCPLPDRRREVTRIANDVRCLSGRRIPHVHGISGNPGL